MPKMHEGRRYDLWWENPWTYSLQLAEIGESQVVLNQMELFKRGISARTFMQQRFHGLPWRCYVADKYNTYLIDHTCPPKTHLGCWPSWDYAEYDLSALKDYMETPWDQRYVHADAQWWEIPVAGQPHRVFVYNVSARVDAMNRKRRQRLSQVQRLYPEVEMFLRQRRFSPGLQFGAGFSAGAIDVVKIMNFERGCVWLTNGRVVRHEDIPLFEKEVNHLSWTSEELQADYKNRLLFNIASFRYAAHHWDDETGPFKLSRDGRVFKNVDYYNPDMYAKMPSYENTRMFHGKNDKVKETDKILCDSCALWRLCPSYRAEAVCGLPGTESKRLADLALSRNSEDVISMLASVVSKQAERAEARIDDESNAPGGYDKEIDKMLNNLFRNGVQLAKLRDPNLGRPLVQINTGPATNNVEALRSSDPRTVAMGVIRELEANGVRREDITEEMINDYLTRFAPSQLPSSNVIDAEVANE